MSTRVLDRRVVCSAGLLLILLFGVVVLLYMEPVAQDPAYHEFADQRPWLRIPNFWNVATNLPFFLVGGIGLWFIGRLAESHKAFEHPAERAAFAVFFAGILLTGGGSGWYHLQPGNERLVWDRLPITLAFMGLFSAVIGERLSLRAGVRLLGPLVAVGMASVAWWAWTERSGHGDLRWYGLVQFFPLVAVILMLAFTPSRYTHGSAYGWVIGLYAAAKLTEVLDSEIYSAGRVGSGHSLKHVLAAGAWVVYLMLRRRAPLKPLPGSSRS